MAVSDSSSRPLVQAIAAIRLDRHRTGAVIGALAAVMVLTVLGPPATAASDALEPGLVQNLDKGDLAEFVVEFAPQADLSAASAEPDAKDRGTAVVDALTRAAEDAQSGVLALVEARSNAFARPYFIRNAVVVHGDSRLAQQIADRPEVSAVRALRTYPLVQPVETKAAIQQAVGDPEWGVGQIGADQVWAGGNIGSGVVVANVDTGVDYTHPALVNSYRGNLGDGAFNHAYNWWDPTGICGDVPCDNDSHGSHTMGTIVGGDGPGPFSPDIGVAPGARWIAAKGCEANFCSEESLLSAGQFLLAPTDLNGLNPDPSSRPDVINNSWGGGPGDGFYADMVTAWRAAGIIPVFAAGNAGPGCETGGSPGDFTNVISAGATDDLDQIAFFSSRGPSPFGKVNPDVAAPGVDVMSSVPGGGYASFSGTSMAAPHTAGTVALLLSAEPDLIGDFDGLSSALKTTAVDRLDLQCGGDADGDPNNVYGDGRIDALAAVDLVATGGLLIGTVTDAANGSVLEGARVSADNGDRRFTVTSGPDGRFQIFLAEGTYTVLADAFGYEAAAVPGATILPDQTTTVDIALTSLPRRTVRGVVRTAEDGTRLRRIPISVVGAPVAPVLTNRNGRYNISLPIGTYTLVADAGGCRETDTATADLTTGDATADFALVTKLDDAGHGCSQIPFQWIDARNQTTLAGDDVSGRLSLPFAFPFYGTEYTRVYVSSNGFLNFLGDSFAFIPSPIPSAGQPNAAVYALWQDLIIDDEAAVEYSVLGAAPNRAFVIEWSNLRELFGDRRGSFEVKLWENGDIDVLFAGDFGLTGDGTTRLDGSDAVVGIENATGTDALQYSAFQRVMPDTAIRFRTAPTGELVGTVTNANDGGPVAGATVTVTPTGRQATTDENGRYRLLLLPGSYTATVEAPGYQTQETPVVDIALGSSTVRDVVLTAPLARLNQTAISATVDPGQQATATFNLRNRGTAPLTWELRERERGATPPTVPPVTGVTHSGRWERQTNVPTSSHQISTPPGTAVIDDEDLELVIDDPDDDAAGPVEVLGLRGGADGDGVAIAIDYAGGTNMQELGGYAFFDTDQDVATGIPPEALAGLPTQDVGVDYFADLFCLSGCGDPLVFIFDDNFNFIAELPATISGSTVRFDVPLAVLGGDDGTVNVDLVAGDFFSATDWVADVGHGTIEPISDANWLSAEPTSGVLRVNGKTVITVTLGGPGVPPGQYSAELLLDSDSPRQRRIVVDVDLEVTLPPEFGAVRGTVVDADDGEPLAAQLRMDAEWRGQPYVATGSSSADGGFELFAPEGTWPLDATREGYVDDGRQVTVVRGQATEGVDVLLHRVQPHADFSGDPIDLRLLTGRTATSTLTLSNPGGRADLNFSVGEIDLSSPVSGPAARTGTARTRPTGFDPNAHTARGLASPVVDGVPQSAGDVLDSWPTDMALPWGVSVGDTITLSDPIELIDVSFTPAGDRVRQFDTPWVGDWAADMAWDDARGIIWQLNIGGDNGIYGLDPTDGTVRHTITGSPWGNISQRGLAYDPSSDTFYVGGWNEGIVYHVAGLSSPTPGEVIGDCNAPDPDISGLAWNAAFGRLWAATNSESDTIYLLDPATCAAEAALPHPDGGGFNGAGLEMDVLGNLWTVSQGSQTAFLVDSGLPNFSDLPWLAVDPAVGLIAPDATQDLTVTIDTTDLAPGDYRAAIVVVTDDPDNRTFSVPVHLRVTDLQIGINVGGPALTALDGTSFAADQSYVAGAYGFTAPEPTRTRTTTVDIAGTDDDGRYQTMRQGPFSYHVDLPAGRYQVDLSFAELAARNPYERIFDVVAEGGLQLDDIDVVRMSGGRMTALDRSFVVEVADGVLDLDFVRVHGTVPLVNSILMSKIPPA